MSGSPQSLLRQLVARDALARLADDVAPIPLMPLKGVLLVALGARKASERPMTDVDVLVRPADAAAALSRARNAGWEVVVGTDVACSLVHRRARMSIDFHRMLFRPHVFAMPTQALMLRGERDTKLFGVEIVRMDVRDLFAHLVGHFVKGRSNRSDSVHLEDFGAVARWSRLGPHVLAAHLEAVGMARAARYALELSARSGDPRARPILEALPRDRAGVLLARLAAVGLDRVASDSAEAIPMAHALNTDLSRGARSFIGHVQEGLRRSPGPAWWQPEVE